MATKIDDKLHLLHLLGRLVVAALILGAAYPLSLGAFIAGVKAGYSPKRISEPLVTHVYQPPIKYWTGRDRGNQRPNDPVWRSYKSYIDWWRR